MAVSILYYAWQILETSASRLYSTPGLCPCPKEHSNKNELSWFQSLAMFCMLYVFFWVIPRHPKFICRHFGTLCLFHLHRRVGEERLNLRIVGVSIREKVWLKNSLPIGSGYFRAKSSPVWIPQQFSNLVILHVLAYEDGTDRAFQNISI
jgi:hypothetical protein